MNDGVDRKERDVLDEATAALRDARIPDGPSPQLAASTVEAMLTSKTALDVIRRTQRRIIMFRIVRYGAAAAAVLLALLAGALWLLDRTASMSFADMVENVKKAKSVSFVLKQKLGNQPELKSKMLIQGNLLRYEVAGAITMIVNVEEKKGLELDSYHKTARPLDLKHRGDIEELKNPIDRLRNLKEDAKDHVKVAGR